MSKIYFQISKIYFLIFEIILLYIFENDFQILENELQVLEHEWQILENIYTYICPNWLAIHCSFVRMSPTLHVCKENNNYALKW